METRRSIFSAVASMIAILPKLSFGQTISEAPPKDQPSPEKRKRLESYTWDAVNHRLKWVVSSGEGNGKGYKPFFSENFEINMDAATMTVNTETRGFSDQEAQNVHTLMNLISKYCADSTGWWEDGKGIKLDENGQPINPEKKPVKKPITRDSVL